MNDFVSKATFGFLMAQFIPGAIALYAVACAYNAAFDESLRSLFSIGTRTLELWSGTAAQQLFLIGLCTGAGMTLHGLHWAVLGYLEYSNSREDRCGAVSESAWHQLPIAVQVLLGPAQILVETVQFLLQAKSIEAPAIEENVTRVPAGKMPAFGFLQDFYLGFAQFYAHTAYALLLALPCIAVCLGYCGVSGRRLVFFLLTWVACGLFFVIGRIQLMALFKAEETLLSGTSEEE